jgi:hypothetical protein
MSSVVELLQLLTEFSAAGQREMYSATGATALII